MTKQEIIATATAKPPSTPDEGCYAHVAVPRDDLTAALAGATNPRAVDLLAGATTSGVGSLVYVQREHLLEALADEPAKV